MNEKQSWIIFLKDLDPEGRKEAYAAHFAGILYGLNYLCMVETEKWLSLTDEERLRLRAAAFTLAYPKHVVVGHTAAWLHGLYDDNNFDYKLEVGNTFGSRPFKSANRTHHWTGRTTADIATIDSEFGPIRLSSKPATIVDLGRSGHENDCVSAADKYIGRSPNRRKVLLEAIRRHYHREGIQHVKLLSHIFSGYCGSVRESILKLRMWKNDIPAPILQCRILLDEQSTNYDPDFLILQYGLIVEYDGVGKFMGNYQRPPGEAHAYHYIRMTRLANRGFRILSFNRENFDSEYEFGLIEKHIRRGKQPVEDVQYVSGVVAWKLGYTAAKRSRKMVAE